jgi:hypothetical protein
MGAERPYTRYSFKIQPVEFGRHEKESNPFLGSVGIISHYMVKNPQQYQHAIQEPL